MATGTDKGTSGPTSRGEGKHEGDALPGGKDAGSNPNVPRSGEKIQKSGTAASPYLEPFDEEDDEPITEIIERSQVEARDKISRSAAAMAELASWAREGT